MRIVILSAALLGLAACAEPSAPASPASVGTMGPVTPVRDPAAEREFLAECAKANANIARFNASMAAAGSSKRANLEGTPCTSPPPDSGFSYARPRPRPPTTTVTCRTWRFASSGNSTVTCTSY